MFAWTDSTVVLNRITGNPCRFKTYVGNRVSSIVDIVPPSRWSISSPDNPADCASRGMFPSKLLTHDLWWNGPGWLRLGIHQLPKSPSLTPNTLSEEAEEVLCSYTSVVSTSSLIPLKRYSSFTRLICVTAWVQCFVCNCRSRVSLLWLSLCEGTECS